jgi:Mg-chelatase subunit ChlI
MSNAKIQTVIENAISKADSSYFFENYTTQAQAVITALNAAGFAVIARDLPDELWKKIADEMRTGRVKPEEHVKDVFQVALRHASSK